VVDDAVSMFSETEVDVSKLFRMGDEEVTALFLGEGGGFSFSAREDAVYTGSLPFFDRFFDRYFDQFFDGEDMVDLPVDGVNYRRVAEVEG
jgi:hypothetical protein